MALIGISAKQRMACTLQAVLTGSAVYTGFLSAGAFLTACGLV
jgi:hypothetical protein